MGQGYTLLSRQLIQHIHTNHNYLKVKPKEIAFYLQDKIELDEIIINAGYGLIILILTGRFQKIHGCQKTENIF